MRKTIALSTAGIAGVVTAGLLALPIASAVTGDDEHVKRDEDAPEVALVEEDDGGDDSADPATRATADHSRNPQTHDGPTHSGPTQDGQTNGGPTHGGPTHDGATVDRPTRDRVTHDGPTHDPATGGTGSGGDVSGATGG